MINLHNYAESLNAENAAERRTLWIVLTISLLQVLVTGVAGLFAQSKGLLGGSTGQPRGCRRLCC
jgi:Co/Zn/Cd efflux system component